MATPAESTEKRVLSEAEKAEIWNGLPEMIQISLNTLNEGIEKHNRDVAIVREFSKDKKSETDTIFELIAKGDYDDKPLLKLKEDIEKAEKLLEDLKLKALQRANTLNLKSVETSEEDAKAALERTKESSAKLRPQIQAIEGMNSLLPVDITIFVKEMDTTRGLRLSSPASSTGKINRPQYTQLFIVDDNGDKELIEKEIEKNGEKIKRSTTTMLAMELTKRGGKNFSVNAQEITEQFFKSQNVDSFDKIKDGVEIPWTFTKDVLNSENVVIGQKSFNLVFVK